MLVHIDYHLSCTLSNVLHGRSFDDDAAVNFCLEYFFAQKPVNFYTKKSRGSLNDGR